MTYGTQYSNASSPVEDVTDFLYQITPEDKPFMAMAGEAADAKDVVHIWQRRSINTRQHNVRNEGFTYVFTAPNQLPTRENNITQILSQAVRVSKTHQAIMHYAIDDMFADQVEQELAGHGTDIEHVSLQGSAATLGATNTERQMAGIIAALKTNVTSYTDFSGTVSFTETTFNDASQQTWVYGGHAKDVLTHGVMKRRISAFTSEQTNFMPADSRRSIRTISMYEGDFGLHEIHLSRDIPEVGISATYSGYDILFVDRSMIKHAFLRRTRVTRTPEIADSDDGVITSEVTLEWGNLDAHYLISEAL